MLKLNENQFNEYVENLECKAQKRVFEILEGGDFDETYNEIDMVYNHGCIVGVGGFIYYNETESFFDEYSSEILELLEELKSEFGTEFLKNVELTKNNLTWLFVENTVRKMIMDLDCE